MFKLITVLTTEEVKVNATNTLKARKVFLLYIKNKKIHFKDLKYNESE